MHTIDMGAVDHRVIGAVLAAQAGKIGDDVFLMAGERRLTFTEVDGLVSRYAGGFAALGVDPGARVAVLMENSIEFVLVALALNRLGAAWVPVNTEYRGEWLAGTVRSAAAGILVADTGLLPRVFESGASDALRTVIVHGAAPEDLPPRYTPLEDLLGHGDLGPAADPSPLAVASVMWTSGTTGRAKGVLQSHSVWLANAAFMARATGVREGDRFYCCLPLYHSAAWICTIFQALVCGLPVGIDRRFSVSDFWDRCRHYEATVVTTLGAMHMYLWQAPAGPDDRDNPVRVAGFVPLPADLVEPMQTRFGIERIWQGYGQSEMIPVCMTEEGGTFKAGSCGRARSDLDVRLLDDLGQEVPAGTPGEICVRPRGPGLMFGGYLNDPEATLAAFRDLWYHTGDLGRRDEDGELYFVDRKADFLRYKGRNISSLEVETVAAQHPGVAEVAVHGVPADELASEDEIKLCVVRVPGSSVSAPELARFVNDRAPYYMVPRYVEFLDELPHTPTGRVRKVVLRERRVTAATWDRVAAGFEVIR
jgi:crotonobetaine/carnitine-CoA ligase